jgi:CelD/BcsL family acetyltransferase involved in cellulose biosynthesis
MMHTSSGDTLVVQRIQDERQFEELRDEWNLLLSESSSNSFFLRWEWLWAWWNAYKEDNWELCIVLCFKGHELLGIAPFYVIRKSWKGIFNIRRLMFLGTKEGSVISEYMDIIYRDGDQEIIVHKIIYFIINKNLCDDMLLHKIDTSSRTITLLKEISRVINLFHTTQDRIECPYINLTGSYERYFNSLSSSMRYNIRNNQRKLGRYENVIFRKTETMSKLDEDFTELVRLHQLNWEKRQFPGSFSGGRFLYFQKAVMPEMLKNGHLDLYLLSVSGKNIAALYNIRYQNKIYFFQAGLDISFDKKLSPGLLLHNYCVNEAISSGLNEYDFLLGGGTESYKRRWTKKYRYITDIYMAHLGILKYMMFARQKAKASYNLFVKSSVWN